MVSVGKSFAVIIPTANRRSYVCQAIERALSHTLPPAEVVVVDDGSTDDTVDTIGEQFPHQVRLIKQAREGVQAARNRGILAANAEWIALLDDDDLWDINYLERAHLFLCQAPEAEALFTSFRVCEADRIVLENKFRSAPIGFWNISGARKVGGDGLSAKFPIENTFNYQPFFPSTTIIHRDLFRTAGGYDSKLRGVKGEDYEFTFRVLLSATCGFLMDAGATVRKHGANDSANSKLLTIGELQILDFIKQAHWQQISREVHPLLDGAIKTKLHSALEAAFTLANPVMVRSFARRIENSLTWGERLKFAISQLPLGVAPQIMKHFDGVGTLRSKIKKSLGAI